MGGLLGRERRRRHAGLGVDFEQRYAVALGVVAEVSAGHAAAAERMVGGFGRAHQLIGDGLRNLSGDFVA